MPQKRKELNISGANLWYLVGLITSDGCLSPDGRHIDITSKDYDFLRKIKEEVGLRNKIGLKHNTLGQKSFHIQFANRGFYDFLLSVGLTQKKSLTLGELKIPKGYFIDFTRGLIDGDGGIQRWIHRTNGREQWNLRIASGSRKFLVWIKNRIEETIGARGRLYAESETQFRLKYGKMAARKIIKNLYYKNCFGLERKIKLAQECCSSRAGWSKSKTVLN